MKKIFILLIASLLSLSLFSQNIYNYEIRAKGGLSIGAGQVKIDSIVKFGSTIKFFSLGSELSPGASFDGDLALDSNNITTTGDIGTTGSRVNHIYTDDITITNSEYLEDVVPLLSDTIPLFTFGLGSGQTGDTAVFNDNALAGVFYNEGSDTLVVTQLMGILAEGTGTETVSVQVSWHATFKSGSATNLNAVPLAITSITTGTSDVSFPNYKIPPNVFVWCTISGVSAGDRPSFLSVTLSGYKSPTY